MKVSMFSVGNLHYAYVDGEEHCSNNWKISLAYAICKSHHPDLLNSRRFRFLINILLRAQRFGEWRIEFSRGIIICAWCGHYKGLRSRLLHFFADKSVLSHGICKKCYEKQMAPEIKKMMDAA